PVALTVHLEDVAAVGQTVERGAGTGFPQPTPVPVPGLVGRNIVAISAGNNYGLALDAGGTIYSWGVNALGVLGVPAPNAAVPGNPSLRVIGGLPPIVQIDAALGHAVARDVSGGLWTWGGNLQGQLGLGDDVSRTTPAPVGSLPPISDVSVHGYYTLALDTNGTVWSYGTNIVRQLGDGSNGSMAWLPVRVGPSAAYARWASYGLGCAGFNQPGAPIPNLASPFSPTLGNAAFRLRAAISTPGAGLQPWLFMTPTPVAPPTLLFGQGFFTNCYLRLDPAVLAPLIAAGITPLAVPPFNIAGQTDILIPIPANPALAGRVVTAQLAAIGATAPQPFLVSNALELTIN
ncbi:MAG: hypothetical protein CMJ83_03590, partial [Planctomycetes bacterium]|nr:hypothetical protein [Planctomycetota bacterium]